MSRKQDLDHLVEDVAATSSAVDGKRTSTYDWFVGEFVGTFILVFFGCGSVAAAVLTGAQVGIFQVAIVWGIAIATAIYLTGSLSGAHLNPAVTLAMAVFGGFPRRRVLPYVAVQLIGALVASAVLYVIFSGVLNVYEVSHGIVRGQPGSEATAMMYGEFYPNPGGAPLTEMARLKMSGGAAFFAEFVATAFLVLVIFCVTDDRNKTRPQLLTPLTIGLSVTLLISLIGPLTMAGMNPARDFAPRVFSSVAGWGSIPWTTNGFGWLTVYIIAPLLGGLAGGAFHRFVLKPAYREQPE
ncbi:MAG: MIP/aquaporin family protein [Chthoniobacterales bacterium]